MLTEDYQTQNVILTQRNDIYFHREEKSFTIKRKREREKEWEKEREREKYYNTFKEINTITLEQKE